MPQSYKIPQNVDLEDKILGPFTLKQFLYLLAAGVLTFIHFSVWYTAAPPVFFTLTFFTWILAVAFVFIKPNDQPFSKFIFSFVNFALKPQRRVWRRIPSLDQIELHDSTEDIPQVAPGPSPDEVRSRLGRLAHIVDTRGWSNLDTEGNVTGRVAAGEATPKLNVETTDSDLPEDILAREEDQTGSDRTSAELDRVLKQGVKKPHLPHDVRVQEAARHAQG